MLYEQLHGILIYIIIYIKHNKKKLYFFLSYNIHINICSNDRNITH